MICRLYEKCTNKKCNKKHIDKNDNTIICHYNLIGYCKDNDNCLMKHII